MHRLGLAGTLAIIAALVAPAMGADATTQLLDQVPLDGEITVDAGRHDIGPARSDGPILTADEWPNGTLSVPASADTVQWSLKIDQPREIRLRLHVCPQTCNMTPNPSRLLATDAGTRQLNATVQPGDLEQVGWVVRTEEEIALDAQVDGHARFLTATTPSVEPRDAKAASEEDPGPSPSRLAAGVLAGLTSVAVARPRLRRWWTAPLAALYHRITRDELLDHPIRERVYELAGEEPGIHFGELKRRTDTARGHLDHHVRRMVDEGLLEERRFDGYRCLFRTGDAPEPVLDAADRVRCETARSVLAALVAEPGQTVASLAARVDVARSTASYHVRRLAEADLVDRASDGAATRLSATDLGRRTLALVAGDASVAP